MAWTDLGLRLVDRLLGLTAMIETGRFLLIDPAGREQRHYSSFAPRLNHGAALVAGEREARAATVPEMARIAALEERTFLRRFKAGTGMTPSEYVQHLRIGKARELLGIHEAPRRSDRLCGRLGHGSLRRLFRRIIGLSPGEGFRTPTSTSVAA